MAPPLLTDAILLSQLLEFYPKESGALPSVLPSQNEQHATVEFLDRETAKVDGLMTKIRKGIEKLKEYRTALISAAVTGKIDVREEIGDDTPQA